MQKSFSALLDMKPYSRYCLYSAIGQAGSVLLFGVVLGFGMPAIALSYVVDYVILVGCSLWWLRRRLDSDYSWLRLRCGCRLACCYLWPCRRP